MSYYKKTGKGAIPTPKVGGSRKQGSATQYELVWSGDDNLREWVPEHDLIDLDEAEVPVAETRNCNTRKDKDKRKNRHTCGIFIGYFYLQQVYLGSIGLTVSLVGIKEMIILYFSCWPCGVCPLFDELYGSESISQVYAIILEFLATLKVADRDKIQYILYGI